MTVDIQSFGKTNAQVILQFGKTMQEVLDSNLKSLDMCGIRGGALINAMLDIADATQAELDMAAEVN